MKSGPPGNKEAFMAEWRFYGRKEKTAELRQFMFPDFSGNGNTHRAIRAWLLTGRRGSGKTALLKRAALHPPDGKPVVYHEMEHDESPGEAALRLRRDVRNAGHGRLLEGLPPVDKAENDSDDFMKTIAALFAGNAVIALDEFHRSINSGTQVAVKKAIDRWQEPLAEPSSARLVLMGSHQQKVREMARPDGTLHGRVERVFQLDEWSLGTVLEMAGEQGLLERPGRFLTLWTAFGGMPRQWKSFLVERQRGCANDFDAFANEDEWRLQFLKEQHERLKESSERFDDRAWIELKPEWRDVLLELGASGTRGLSSRDLAARLGTRDGQGNLLRREADRMLARLRQMRREIQAVDQQGTMEEDSESVRWNLQDANMLFQLRVFPEMFRNPTRRPRNPAEEGFEDLDFGFRLERLKQLEGQGLERLAAAWILAMSRRHRSRHRAWGKVGIRQEKGGPDIDAMGITGPTEEPRLTVAWCKRHAGSHDPERNEGITQAVLRSMEGIDPEIRHGYGWGIPGKEAWGSEDAWRKAADAWQRNPANIRHVAISPAFREPDKGAFEGRRTAWSVMDIRDIAAEMAELRIAPSTLSG